MHSQADTCTKEQIYYTPHSKNVNISTVHKKCINKKIPTTYIFYKIYMVGRQRSKRGSRREAHCCAKSSSVGCLSSQRRLRLLADIVDGVNPTNTALPDEILQRMLQDQILILRETGGTMQCLCEYLWIYRTTAFLLRQVLHPREIAAPPWSKNANKFEIFKSLCVFAQQ